MALTARLPTVSRTASAKAAGARRASVTARAEPERKDLVFGGMGADKQTLTYLTGELPGDRGFDPLGLSDPRDASAGFVTPSWLAYAEVIHCRWAMLGAAGCLAPELLGSAGIIPAETGLPWFASGVIPPAGEFEYWTDSSTLFLSEMVLMGFAETRRLQDYRKPGSQSEQFFLGIEKAFGGSGNPAYPGGQWFNMAGMGKTEAEMKSLKSKEIENGRLAMIAMLGYFIQASFTHVGPYANLQAHLSDPVANNILTTFGKMGSL